MARILIVEDNEMCRKVLRMVLETVDHAVEEAADGDIALLCDLATFDLVITDICMPNVSGFDVIKAVTTVGVPIVAVSGGDRLSGDDPLATALALGAALALRKPYSMPQILSSVEECLGGAPSPRVIEYARDGQP